MLTFVWSSLHLFRGAVPVVIAPLLLSIAIATAYALWGPSPRSRPYAKIPIASFDANEYAERGREVLNRGTATGGLFQINAGTEWQIIIPAAFADELKSHPDLLFHKAHALELLPYYPGFEAFKVGIDEGQFIHEVTQRKLTPKLGLVTEGIVDETIAAFEERFGESKEWHTQALQADALEFCGKSCGFDARILLIFDSPSWHTDLARQEASTSRGDDRGLQVIHARLYRCCYEDEELPTSSTTNNVPIHAREQEDATALSEGEAVNHSGDREKPARAGIRQEGRR